MHGKSGEPSVSGAEKVDRRRPQEQTRSQESYERAGGCHRSLVSIDSSSATSVYSLDSKCSPRSLSNPSGGTLISLAYWLAEVLTQTSTLSCW